MSSPVRRSKYGEWQRKEQISGQPLGRTGGRERQDHADGRVLRKPSARLVSNDSNAMHEAPPNE
jgi:hypothetical protein